MVYHLSLISAHIREFYHTQGYKSRKKNIQIIKNPLLFSKTGVY
jgi:hypothetical protein